MTLSAKCVLVYVLRKSGCAGRLNLGRVERHGSSGVNVYDRLGNLIEYISGDRVRSWCLFGGSGVPLENWSHVVPDDASAIRTQFSAG